MKSFAPVVAIFAWSFSVGTAVVASAAGTAPKHEVDSVPRLTLPRISYQELLEQHNHFSNQKVTTALQDLGMVAISNLLQSAVDNDNDNNTPDWDKSTLLQAMETCVQAEQALEQTRVESYADGTIRHSLGRGWNAASTNQEDHSASIPPRVSTREECAAFEQQSARMRPIFDKVLQALAVLLEHELELDHTPLLHANRHPPSSTTTSSSSSYTLVDIVEQGDVIEHYHVYHSSHHKSDKESDTVRSSGAQTPVPPTMDWHVDQGLFLLFFPGVANHVPTDGLYVQLRNGSTAHIEFDPNQDDLVILLGDGVQQFVNPALVDHAPLRAVPHAFTMPRSTTTTNNEPQDSSWSAPRLWYGRMVLPPPHAQHPLHPEWTYGTLRSAMTTERVQGNQQGPALSIGCSEPFMRALSETGHTTGDGTTGQHGGGGGEHGTKNLTCGIENETNNNTFPCWHQCMNITEDETVADCESQGLEMACVTDWTDENEAVIRLLWDGSHASNAFFPGCIDTETALVYDPDIHGPSSSAAVPSSLRSWSVYGLGTVGMILLLAW